MNDAHALLAAILAQPDEDTPRLMYADCIEDTDPDRAELIRVQVELSQWRPYVAPPEILEIANSGRVYSQQAAEAIVDAAVAHRKRKEFLVARESALIAANADRWRRGPVCESCDGKGNWGTSRRNATGLSDCPDCFGTGDAGGLMRRMDTHAGDHNGNLPVVTYHRGMKRVHCRGEDVWEKCLVECPECEDKKLFPRNLFNPGTAGPSHVRCSKCHAVGTVDSWRPTPWARAVCRHHPDVCEFWFTDCATIPPP